MRGRIALLLLALVGATGYKSYAPKVQALYELPRAVGPTSLAGRSGDLNDGDVILSLPVYQGWVAQATELRSLSFNAVTRTFRPDYAWTGYSFEAPDRVNLNDRRLRKVACGFFEPASQAVVELNKGQIEFSEQTSICLEDRDRDGTFEVAFLAGVESSTVSVSQKITPVPYLDVYDASTDIVLELVYSMKKKSRISSFSWIARRPVHLRKYGDAKFPIERITFAGLPATFKSKVKLDFSSGPQEIAFGTARIRIVREHGKDRYEFLQDLDRVKVDVSGLF